MESLRYVLSAIDVQGSLYFRTQFTGAWGLTVPFYEHSARFHLMVQGRCCIKVGDAVVDMSPGDLLIIPNGASHVLADAPDREAPPLESVLERAGYKGQGVLVLGQDQESAETQLVCGHFTFARGGDHALIRALPPFVLIKNADRRARPFLDDALSTLVRRVFQDPLGAEAVLKRYAEIVFIEVVLAACEADPGLGRILSGGSDPQIGAALELVHRAPERGWSVAELARAAGMSRSRFAERFQELIGCGPMAYVTERRLQRAATLLSEGRLTIGEIARAAGYWSPTAFSRAFSARFGLPPRAFRAERTDGSK